MWECLFRVTVVDAVVRLAGMGAKALVVVAARAAPEERCRRRGQVRCLNPSSNPNKRQNTRQVCMQACILSGARCGSSSWHVPALRGPAVSRGAAAPSGTFGTSALAVRPRVLLQVLTLVEHAVLLYRALLPTPAWVRYFEGAGLGSVLTVCYTGAPRLPQAPSGSLAIRFASEFWLSGCGQAVVTFAQRVR